MVSRTRVALWALILAVGATSAQGWTPALQPQGRPSPLPLFYQEGPRFHTRLVGLPQRGLNIAFLDVFIPSAEQPLLIQRRYRNASRSAGIFGKGWSSNLDVRITIEPKTRRFVIFEADGGRTRYKAVKKNLFQPIKGAFPQHSLLKTKAAGKDVYVRRVAGGGPGQEFDARGRLVAEWRTNKARRLQFAYADGRARHPNRITDTSGRSVKLEYAAGLLSAVTDPIGRTIRYRYRNRRLAEVVDAVGRKTGFRYYASGRLARVILPRGSIMRFRYAADGALREVAGPGTMKTAFRWSPSPGKTRMIRTTTFANGTTETLEITPAKLDPKAWPVRDPRTLIAEGPGGLQLRRTDGEGVASTALVLKSRILFKGNVQLPGVASMDAAGRLDRAKELPGVGSPLDGPNWRSRVAPAKIPSGDPAIRYDKVGRPVEFTEAGGKETWKWDKADRVAQWTADGRTTTFRYDAHNNLTGVVVNKQAIATFGYDKSDRLVSCRNAAGKHVRIAHDAYGNVTEIAQGKGGQSIRMKYDRANRPVAILDADGGTTRIEYNGRGQKTRIVDPSGKVREFIYDATGKLIARSNGRGEKTTYTWDAQGRLSRAALPDKTVVSYVYGPDSTRVRVKRPDGLDVSREYDAGGQLTKLLMPGGRTVDAAYDDNGLLVGVKDSSYGEVAFKHDNAGRVLSESVVGGPVRTYAYDEQGRYASIQEDNVKTTFKYREDGSYSAVIANGDEVLTLTYDRQSRLVSQKDDRGNETRNVYTAEGRLGRVESSGGTILYQYNDAGRVTGATHRSKGAKDASVAYTYDAAGKLTSITHEDGTKESFRYDAAGRAIGRTDRLGNESRVEYDKTGNIRRLVEPFGTHLFKYDPAGRLVEETHPRQGTRRYEYPRANEMIVIAPGELRTRIQCDELGRPLVVTNALGGKIRRTYDKAGRLIAFVDPNGNTHAFVRDGQGRVTRRLTPTGKKYQTAYTKDGRPLTRTLPTGQRVGWAYGASGRLKSRSADGKVLWQYEYDRRGRVSVVEGAGGKSHYVYDDLNRLTTYTASFDKAVRITYDDMGRLETVTAAGETFRCHYAKTGLLAAIETSRGKFRLGVDGKGRFERYTSPNGLVVTHTYDSGSRIKSIHALNAKPKAVSKEQYVYDVRGNLASLADSSGTRRFKYDKLNRLVEARWADGKTERYQYNSSGAVIGDHNAARWSYNADQELLQ